MIFWMNVGSLSACVSFIHITLFRHIGRTFKSDGFILYVKLCPWRSLASTGWIFMMKFYTGGFYKNLSTKLKFE